LNSVALLQTRPDAEAVLMALDGLVLHDMEMKMLSLLTARYVP
jgi:hypothetical protein